MLSIVSLKHSLAGIAMKEAHPVQLLIPAGAASTQPGPASSRVVACVPVFIPPPEAETYKPLAVGALLFGAVEEIPGPLGVGILKLAGASGPALFTVGLGRVKHLSHLLSLRDHDAEYVGAQEDMQDLPLEISRPGGFRLGGSSGPTQPLTLSRPQREEASKGIADKITTSKLGTCNPFSDRAADAELPGFAAQHEEQSPKQVARNPLPLFSDGTVDWHAAKKSSGGAELQGDFVPSKEIAPALALAPGLTFSEPKRESERTTATSRTNANVVSGVVLAAMDQVFRQCMLSASAPAAQPIAWAVLATSLLLPWVASLKSLIGQAWWLLVIVSLLPILTGFLVYVFWSNHRKRRALEISSFLKESVADGSQNVGRY